MTDGKLGTRLAAMAAIVTFLFAALVTRLWFLQVLAVDDYREAAQSNRVRLIPLSAPRGRILDTRGEALVTNQPTTVLIVDKRHLPRMDPAALSDGEREDMERVSKQVFTEERFPDESLREGLRQDFPSRFELLSRVSDVLDVPVKRLTEEYYDQDNLPYQPIVLHQGLTKAQALFIGERPLEFPGMRTEMIGVRKYVYGDLAPHLLGRLGQLDPSEAGDPSFSDHLPGELVGRGGIEQQYQQFLRGENGWLKIEVDSQGNVLRELGRKEPIPGNDVVLSVDRRVQEIAQDTMDEAVKTARNTVRTEDGYAQATAGAIVVLNPNDGHVLAMASYPTYDPRIFQDGLTKKEQRKLERSSSCWECNWAIAGLYPPASTFKPFVAAAAIKAGFANPGGFYPCPAEYVVPGDESGTVFKNWSPFDRGSISLSQSLVESCDTVYYNFGLKFYVERKARGELFQQQLRRWGFQAKTGIDIPGEATGRIPDAEWKEEQFPNDLGWLPGDDINMSVGQGFVLVTPLQLGVAYGALANGGTLYRPQLVQEIVSPQGKVLRKIGKQKNGRAPAKGQTIAFLREAMRGVVTGEGGTATGAFSGFPHSAYPVSAKTGTAEVIVDGHDANHSWFAAMAPADDPDYVVVALVEEGGHGSEVAAPIVRRVLEGLLGLEPGEFRVGTPTD